MYRFNLKVFIFLSILLVPLLTFVGSPWINIYGIPPCWIVLWMLPWSLKEGENAAIIAGLAFGLLFDGLSISIGSQMPILILLGFWWGRLGRQGSEIKQSFVLGFLAWFGTLLFGFSNWIQTILFEPSELIFNYWGLQTLLAQSFVTGLLAPLVCSWLLLLWRPRSAM